MPRVSFTEAEQADAEPVGFPGVRVWSDADYRDFAPLRPAAQPGRARLNYLALSGGGGDGAFGAGLLAGWTQSGTRPAFQLVTGVSTGALIAPFAFLGPDWDDDLREMYTGGHAERLVETPNLAGLLGGDGLYGGRGLRSLVARFIDEEVVSAVAREHDAGRRLLVLTTNLDAQRGMLWNMGAIARRGDRQALDLFRDVLTASASIPVGFAPVEIGVEAGTKRFTEMHVDGGVTAPVFTVPPSLLTGSNSIVPQPVALFVVMNSKVEPTFQVTERSTTAEAARTVSVMTKGHSRDLLSDTARFAAENDLRLRAVYLPRELPEAESMTGMETDHMRRLYDYGLAQGKTGDFWLTDGSASTEGRLRPLGANRPVEVSD